jgi:hypothetical protein
LHFGKADGISDKAEIVPVNIYTYDNNIYVKKQKELILNGKLAVYSLQEQELLTKTLKDQFINIISWEGAPGIYIARVVADNLVTAKELFIK